MSEKRLAAKWESFDAALLRPMQAGALQRQEMRRAFYAGAQAFLGILMSDLDPEAEPTDADMDMMTGLQAELEQFSLDVVAGRR